MPGDYLRYSAMSGTWFLVSGSTPEVATPIAHGWAGNHAGKNNPDMDDIPSTGPLPAGWYTIGSYADGKFVEGLWEASHGHLGPMVAFLKPDAANEMHGRGDFFIHGPSMGANYGQESKGCTVLPHDDRLKIKNLGLTRLVVVR